MDLGIQGKSAIICASSRGLGKACAYSLAINGVNIILNGRNEEVLEKTKAEILKKKESVLLKSLNPSDRRIVHQAINDDDRFLSSSIGDGRFKQVQISLKE